MQILYEVINERDKSMMSGLVITSNYSLHELAKRMTEGPDDQEADRIVSRLGGLCRAVKVGGPDWRVMR